jgi:hypothetical protein
MLPLTLLAPQKLLTLLTLDSELQTVVHALATANGQLVPPIASSQILISSLTPDMADKNAQLTYPRVCVYCTQVKNTHQQKFRSFSGPITLAADIWFSANLLTATATGLHYYVQALASILQANQGDWGDGFYFSGLYDVQLQTAKAGGFGFVEMARITCALDVDIA